MNFAVRGFFFHFIILFIFAGSAQAQKNKTTQSFVPYRAFIDSVEADQNITVFTKPGLTWKSCTIVDDPKTKDKKCKEAVGWPSRDATIKVISPPVKAFVTDPISDEEIEETYVKVEFEYKREGEDGKIHHQKGEGYIEMHHLSRSAHNAYYGAQPAKKKPCPPDQADANKETKKLGQDVGELAKSLASLDIRDQAAELNKFVGHCPFVPPSKMAYQKDKSKNVYDQLILPQLKSQKVPPLTREDGKTMTQQDLISIDSIARTLYGEMGGCFSKGLHYPMAVAKIIVNRANTPKYHRSFIQKPHEANKPTISQVATTPSQFSMWHHSMVKIDRKTGKPTRKPNGPLHQGLCPPVQKGKPFYRGAAASRFENDIWTNAMRIATEAVLHPKKFEKRAGQVKDLHYTSDLAKYKYDPKLRDQMPSAAKFILSMNQVNPEIEGRKIDSNRCLEIWQMQ